MKAFGGTVATISRVDRTLYDSRLSLTNIVAVQPTGPLFICIRDVSDLFQPFCGQAPKNHL
jgi:hypothetical protein